MWRRVFIKWPAKIVTGYFQAYKALLMIGGVIALMVLIPLAIIELVLWLFGIRWGW